MRAVVQPDGEAVGTYAAELIERRLRENPRLVLGLPTGQTPLPMYAALIRRQREAGLDFSQVTTFNLDEYVGLPAQDPRSYAFYMEKHFFAHVALPRSQVFLPNGEAADPYEEALRYEQLLQSHGGLDLAIVGIGRNGHIGFNEPAERLMARTHVAVLSEETRTANARFFGSPEAVPPTAITVGMAAVGQAKEVLLLASGSAKAAAVAAACSGEVTTHLPASLLQLHPNATFLLDRQAAAQLRDNDGYE
ncbi:MAG: glucosamine-6-phosphate deaminase [Firmicutes bacterium]|nr:glucosamine-6-phosphate deaminase [Bacillota bacterium]